MSNQFSKEKLADAEAMKMERLLHAIQTFREIRPDMPASSMVGFLTVALKPGITPTETSKHVGPGWNGSMTSRMLLELGAKKRSGGEGEKLIEQHQDLQDLRMKRYTLTAAGRRLLNKLVSRMGVANG